MNVKKKKNLILISTLYFSLISVYVLQWFGETCANYAVQKAINQRVQP